MWPPQDHSDNERKYGHQLTEGWELQTAATGHPFLTSALHISPGNPRLFPANLWTPLEMSPFGGWGWLGTAHSLSCPDLMPR